MKTEAPQKLSVVAGLPLLLPRSVESLAADFADVHDDLNDEGMLGAVDYGIAMGHTQPSVEQHAAWVTTGNREDGVTKLLAALDSPCAVRAQHGRTGESP